MIGILIISHGPLAKGIMESCGFFSEDQRYMHAEILGKEDDPACFLNVLKDACKAFEKAEGILILTDIPGGTPANVAQLFMQDHPHIRLLSGVNLMMALDAVLSREMYDLDELAHHCMQSAKESIRLISVEKEDENCDNDAEF